MWPLLCLPYPLCLEVASDKPLPAAAHGSQSQDMEVGFPKGSIQSETHTENRNMDMAKS